MNMRLVKSYTGILVGAIVILLTVRFALAWTTPINISNTSGASRFASMAIDDGDNIHVVWEDETSGNIEILYCFNNGINWSFPQNISRLYFSKSPPRPLPLHQLGNGFSPPS